MNKLKSDQSGKINQKHNDQCKRSNQCRCCCCNWWISNSVSSECSLEEQRSQYPGKRLISLTSDIFRILMDLENVPPPPEYYENIANVNSKNSNGNKVVAEDIVEVCNELHDLNDSMPPRIYIEDFNTIFDQCLNNTITIIKKMDSNDLDDSDTNGLILIEETSSKESLQSFQRNIPEENIYVVSVLKKRIAARPKSMSKTNVDTANTENVVIIEGRLERLEDYAQRINDSEHESEKNEPYESPNNIQNTKEERTEPINTIKAQTKQTDELSAASTTSYTAKLVNKYDELYYEQRQYAMNLLHYEKSMESLRLNERPALNPHIMPVDLPFWDQNKIKQRPKFIDMES